MSQTHRIFYIDRTIREKGGVTTEQVANFFEVSSRQVKRDIEYLRDRLGAPIVYRSSTKRYEYETVWEKLAFADEKSLLAAAFVESILTAYNYVPLVSDELVSQLRGRIAGPYERIVNQVRYELSEMEQIRGDITYTFCQALLSHSFLTIQYVSYQGSVTSRTILPLRLINYGGKWYSLAWDVTKKALRTFSISRIQSVQMNKENIQIDVPSDEEIEAFLRASYGIFKGEAIGRATLRFYGGAARALRHQIWHPEQRLVELSQVDDPQNPLSPVVELTLPVRDWTEILGKALYCGRYCEVLDPPEFRQRWKEEILALTRLAGLDG
ncbi:MAG TPA: WYL domain-containing protein [Treponema sp.]|jgi:predicted DNA-binding transcriptional regulator YafY|nr:WYL domain-containing protein [Treponema sp.]